jgi:hypothetical protein
MESGHAKNVANFETVTIILIALGAVYSPAQALILLAALQTKLTEAKSALAAVDNAQGVKTLAVDELQAEFEDFDEYLVNIKRTAEVEINDPALTSDLQNIVNRSRPQSRKTGLVDNPLTPENEARTGHSTSMRSYDSLITHLADVHALLSNRSDYKPGDAQYTIAAIEAKISSLTAKNNAAKNAAAALGNTEDARDVILYDEQTGVLKLIKLIKIPLTLKPGKASAAYQQISALEFRKY